MAHVITALAEYIGLVPPHLPSAENDIISLIVFRLVASALTGLFTVLVLPGEGCKTSQRWNAIVQACLNAAWFCLTVAWYGMVEFNGQGFTLDVAGTFAAGHLANGMNSIAANRAIRNIFQALTLTAVAWLLHVAVRHLLDGAAKATRKSEGPRRAFFLRILCAAATAVLLIANHPLYGQVQRVLLPKPIKHYRPGGHGYGSISKDSCLRGPIPVPLTVNSPLTSSAPSAVEDIPVPQEAVIGFQAKADALISMGFSLAALLTCNSSVPLSNDEFLYFRTPIALPRGKSPVQAMSLNFGTSPIVEQEMREEESEGNGEAEPVRKHARLPNIVFITAEAIESSYFDTDVYPGLMPNLTDIASQGLYFPNMYAPFGVTFSMAGKIASLCGMPMPLPPTAETNEIANWKMSGEGKSFAAGTHCLTDLLSRYGYFTELHSGMDIEFAGFGNFGRHHGANTYLDMKTLKAGWKPPQPCGVHATCKEGSSWGYVDSVMLNVTKTRIDQLKAAQKAGNTSLAYLPDSMVAPLLAREEAHSTHKLISSPGAPFAVILETMDTHNPPEQSPVCKELGREIYSHPDWQWSWMHSSVHCADLMIAQLIKDVADENTVVIVVGDHQNNDISTRRQSVPWNEAKDEALGVTSPRASAGSEERADGRRPGQRCRVFAAIYAPGRIAPATIPRLCTQYDLVPTLLDAVGLDVVALGMGRSLLRQEHTLPEWALEHGIDHDDELQSWAYDDGIRQAMWGEEGGDREETVYQCSDCAIRTFSSSATG